jgi:hypothetical protein
VFRLGWEKVDAKMIDQRFLRRDSYNVNKGGSGYQVWEYMVELPGADGNPVRLTIEEKTFKLKDPQIGDIVPVLVNKKRTKAAFNLKDPRIDAVRDLEAREKARKARDEARFEAKRKGLD